MQPSTFLFLASTYAVATSAIAITSTPEGFCTPSNGNGTLIPGTTCTAECMQDRPGGDFIPGQQVASLEACAAACTSNAACLTASFVPSTSFCYLKNFILNPQAAANVNGVICRTCADGKPIPNTRCVEECNTDRPGNDYKAVQFEGADGLQRCGQLCDREERCTTAQYRADNRFCYLKERTNAPVSDSNVNGVVCTSSSA